jgi:hypothetical protein
VHITCSSRFSKRCPAPNARARGLQERPRRRNPVSVVGFCRADGARLDFQGASPGATPNSRGIRPRSPTRTLSRSYRTPRRITQIGTAVSRHFNPRKMACANRISCCRKNIATDMRETVSWGGLFEASERPSRFIATARFDMTTPGNGGANCVPKRYASEKNHQHKCRKQRHG